MLLFVDVELVEPLHSSHLFLFSVEEVCPFVFFELEAQLIKAVAIRKQQNVYMHIYIYTHTWYIGVCITDP